MESDYIYIYYLYYILYIYIADIRFFEPLQLCKAACQQSSIYRLSILRVKNVAYIHDFRGCDANRVKLHK